MDPICAETFDYHMQKVSALVEKKIALRLPENFVLVLYKWTSGSLNYVGVFDSYSANETELLLQSTYVLFHIFIRGRLLRRRASPIQGVCIAVLPKVMGVCLRAHRIKLLCQ